MSFKEFSKWLLYAPVAGLVLAACQQASIDPVNSPSTIIETAPDNITVMSIQEIERAMNNGDLTSEKLVKSYLNRIETLDHNGPRLQSVLSINPDALSEARRLDQLRKDGEVLGPLHGVPVLLKDNIESKDNLPTTAGAFALKDNITGRDSPLAAGLRAQGAIILGKTNLSQWANFRSNESMSGWSALGGQTKNPHILDRNPCGSSSGSGAATAAFMAAGAVGTETNGSVICPSNANGIVGFKPTVGLVSQQYIVPISSSQDTAGPMTRSVAGAAIMLDAMDNQTINYLENLDAKSLSGARVGVMRFAEGSNADIIDRFNSAIKDIEKLGAEIVEIDEFSLSIEGYGGKSFDVLKYEFKHTLNEYLADTPDSVSARTLSSVIAFNADNAHELALFDQDIVDVLISPSGPVAGRIDPINGDVWPSWAGAGYLAAVAGYPHITVPMGEIDGMPIGLSFMGGEGEDAKILSFGYAYEQATLHIKAPEFLKTAEDQKPLSDAMSRKID